MKLTYRDRVILLVVIALVILVGGFALLIKPRYDDIQKNKKTLDTVQAEWDGYDAKIQEIPQLRDKITEVYNDSKALSDDFYTEYMQPHELDQFMQEIVDKCNLRIAGLEVGTASNASFEYYYHTPTIPAVAIFDLADINGEYSLELAKTLEESAVISARNVEEVLVQQYGISFKSTKENLYKFMEEINKLDKSIVIQSVNITDTNYGTNPVTGELLPTAETQKDSTGKDVGVSAATIVVNVYSVYELDEPVLE